MLKIKIHLFGNSTVSLQAGRIVVVPKGQPVGPACLSFQRFQSGCTCSNVFQKIPNVHIISFEEGTKVLSILS